jgi:ABC-2 type transport system ATP-binding protein
VQSTDETVIASVLKRMITDGLPVTDFHREERRLEDAFIDLLGQIDKVTYIGAAAVNVMPPPLPE